MRLLFVSCLSLLLMLGGCQSSSAQQDEEVTTFILVRHAEKAMDGSEDPPLTEAGRQRAEALASLFDEIPIDAVYSTNYRRTRETARPLAIKNRQEIQLYEAHQEKPLLERLKEEYRGKTVLIVGHSNTIPFAVNELLGQDRLQELPESEYTKVFVVSQAHEGRARLLPLVLELPEATP